MVLKLNKNPLLANEALINFFVLMITFPVTEDGLEGFKGLTPSEELLQ